MELNIEFCWGTVESTELENSSNFWKVILLSVLKPHLINRRLAGAEQVIAFHSKNGQLNEQSKIIKQICQWILDHPEERAEEDFVEDILVDLGIQHEFEEIDVNHLSKCDLSQDKQIIIILNKLLPKNLAAHKCTYELNILDSINNEAGYLNLLQNQTTGFIKRFMVQLKKLEGSADSIVVTAPNEANENFTRQTTWIKHVFKPKILKWMSSMKDDYEDQTKSVFDTVESLSLVNLTEYNQLYNDLKIKYGEHMVKIWPENTDPLKFVYEDVAIASYLILLWREERRRLNTDRLQSFVDLGCGNGLLVYILSGEGHQGYGIDLRKRGIWDLYPKTTILKTLAIVPSDSCLFPDVDWIIGNHSDELSPWIPVISARSSYNSRYFLLPCCAFEFNGKKFQRRSCSISQYMDFLSYAQQISEICGFKTDIDRLKIPSTKRICLIGSERIYDSSEQTSRENQIQEFINTHSGNSDAPADTNNWNQEFQPRSDVQKVQNCTKIDKSIQNDIVDRVFNELIMKKRFLDNCPNWNAGGRITLNDLVKTIPSEKLKALKSECGGLQTLLKNHSHIFQVVKGIVEFRFPLTCTERKRDLEAKGIEVHLQQKPCWFHSNHPDGCPLSNSDCSFKHL